MPSNFDSLQQQLLTWYRKHKRALPWRETKDPYFIWISEIMLQQTRVETVVPYYQRFTQRFPQVETLANADEHDVLKHWQGLGYYRRAKLLHKAAKEITEKYNGRLPETREELATLPGFGPYTSGAVASIAFNVPAPAIDGNVKRVLSRIFATNEPIDATAEQLANVDSPSDWTQALMELGAIICVPKNPKCLVCPVRDLCKAYRTQTVDQFPAKTKKTVVREIHAKTWMIKHPKKNEVLIQQRSQDGRWAGMWEFPTMEFEKKSDANAAESFSFKTKQVQDIGGFKHQLTHRTIHVRVVQAVADSKIRLAKEQKWITHEKLSDFPVSKMQLRAWELFKNKN